MVSVASRQTESNLLAAALRYAGWGWRVLPLKGKLPKTEHGCTDATTNTEMIRQWFSRSPNVNVGIATGAASGIFVVDFDGECEIPPALQNLPHTISAKTTKGRHLFFRYPDGRKIGNRTKVNKLPIDVRGEGGYVVGVESIHPESRKPYTWINDPESTQLAEAPTALLDWIDPPPKPQPAPPRADDSVLERARKYLAACPAAISGQNGHGTTFATVCASVWGFDLSPDVAFDVLQSWNARCEPPWSDQELRHKIDDSLKATHEKPRGHLRDAPLNDFHLPSRNTTKHTDPVCLTDVGNAKRFASDHRMIVRYCHPWGRWLIWDGGRWKPDDAGHAKALAKKTILRLYAWAKASIDLLAADEGSDDKGKAAKLATIKAILAHALKSQDARRINAMLDLARSETGIPVSPDQLDSNIWLFNCTNGTLDLHTGELQPHNQADYITKLCPVAYDPKATCPTWQRFILEILKSETMVAYKQRLAGYWLTGRTDDHVLPVLWGVGANGKSTEVNTIFSVMGPDYSGKAHRDLLLAAKGDRHPTALAWLHGKRFVACIETGDGARLDEALVKELTGGDTVTARRMREDFWTFQPTHKICLVTNHRPSVKGTDAAIWRRLRLIPYTVVFSDDKQDKKLPEKLQAELPGILAWMVQGCLAWQRHGLADPPEVVAATADYRSAEDRLGEFLAERCQLNREFRVKASDLYATFKDWSKANGEPELSGKAFGNAMAERGFDKDAGKRWYLGLAFAAQDEGK